MEEFRKDPNNVMKLFMSTFVQENGYDHSEVITKNGNIHTQTIWKGKSWVKSNYGKDMLYLKTQHFSIVFASSSINTVELYILQVKDKGKGIGTEAMNQVLDVADGLGINVCLIPSGYQDRDDMAYHQFLRSWYASFGFVSSPLSPIMTYKAKNN
jgi:hypothetical protein